MMMVSTVNYYVKTMMNGATVDCHLQQRMGWNLHASIVALLLWRGGGVCCHGWLLLSSPSTTSSSRCVLPHYCSYSADLFSAGFRAKPCRHVQLYAAPTVEINSNNNNNDPNLAQKLVFQGMEAFRMGRIDESIQWFDQAQALRPTLLPYLWQRGISYYYAGKYAEASRQFRTDVQVNPLDVEEIVWDIAAQSQQQKTKNGQNSIQMMALPQGKTDRRKIMSTVYSLFRGEGTEHDLAVAGHTSARPADEFYALFYLGLYCEAQGEPTKASQYMLAATRSEYANSMGRGDYMTSVARVHCQERGWR